MSEQPAATLLLMTYNQAPFLAEAIASALAQEGPPLEILVSDNGSTDTTPAVVAWALDGYRGAHRVRQHRFPENLGGPAEHVNAALPLTTGRVVLLQAGDDLSLPGRALATCRAFAADPALLCLYSDVEVIDAAGRHLRPGPQAAPPTGTASAAWFARVQSFALGACLALDRRLAGLFPPLPPGVFEDQALPFRAALAGRVRHLPETLVRYRLHGANTWANSCPPQTVGELRRLAERAVAQHRRVGAARRADLAAARRLWPERAAELDRLEQAVAASLAEAEHQRRITVGPLPRRLLAALCPPHRPAAGQRLRDLLRAGLPALELRLRRRGLPA